MRHMFSTWGTNWLRCMRKCSYNPCRRRPAKYPIDIINYSKLKMCQKISSGKLQNFPLIITYIRSYIQLDCNHVMECCVITSTPLPDIDNINNNFLKRPQQPINLLLNTCFPFMSIEIFLIRNCLSIYAAGGNWYLFWW
jgi:hypothetical protein